MQLLQWVASLQAWILCPSAAATHPALGDRAVPVTLLESSFTGLEHLPILPFPQLA